ncbi:uncharacterized protein BYT42DRAFT_591670 [Radiomyces spectabilis]|uniref:uncharacterized protein n=1 Tax=Radiomyces spectabilis TaxID=64574 RepID=UPI00221F18C4|nr:uncharacterized protein BYT42DRAFT_591670 [Radiomyces spectabilis]KAI8390833.1 hypothetical protein BYT42DRAFT_591670 [Radiomyces spectabilis]
MAFQRKSHIINDQLSPVELQKPSYRRPMWVAAATTYLVANIIGSVFSIGYLPIVTLAPISALGLVFNAFAAWGVLGDPLTRRSVLGTGSIVIGTLLVGLFGVIIEPDHDIDDLIQLYHKTTFIIYFSILEFVIVTALIFTHYFEQLYFKLQKQNFMPDQPRLKWLASADFRMYLGISYGMIAGNISSQSMLFAKSGFELFILTIVFNMDQLHYPLTWVLVSMVIVTAILQLYYLNKGLRLCDTVILVPLSSCAFNVSCLFNGLVYYDQWSRLRWEQIIMVTLGVSLIICGVLILSWRGGTSTAHLQENTATEMGA